MRDLFLDYQRKSLGGSWVGRGVLAAGALMAAFAVHTFIGVNNELGDLEFRLARLERKPGPVLRGPVRAQDAKRYADEINFANLVAERLTLPWEELFSAVETVTVKDVALLALEPDVQKKLLRITAEAKSKADMLSYVRQLAENKRLIKVYLINHEFQVQAPGQPVRFSLQASWAATPHEQN